MGTKKNKNENELAASDQSNAGKGIFTPVKAVPEEGLQTPNGPDDSKEGLKSGSGEFELEKEKETEPELGKKELEEKGPEESANNEPPIPTVNMEINFFPEGRVGEGFSATVLGVGDGSIDLTVTETGEEYYSIMHSKDVKEDNDSCWDYRGL